MSEYYKTSCPDRYEFLKEHARSNRNFPTDAECCLWNAIRNKQLGVRFRRQHAIEDYIPDFVCLSSKLIIEVDGKYHDQTEQETEDTIRTHHLETLGFKVIRFTNDEIYNELDKVIEIIKTNL